MARLPVTLPGKRPHSRATRGESAASQQHDGGRVVEIGANRQSCDPSVTLLFKLVLEVVLGVASSPSERSKTRDRCRIPREIP